MKYALLFDGYLGKGCFYIFWGFLLWSKKAEWMVLALVYLGGGVVFIIAQFTVEGPIHHLSGDRPASSAGRNTAPPSVNHPAAPDPYLATMTKP